MAKDGKTETEMAMNGWINADLAYQGLEGGRTELRSSEGHRRVQHAADLVHGRRADPAGRLEPPARRARRRKIRPRTAPSSTAPALVQVGPDGKFQMVGDPTKPWMCFPGEHRDWSDPVPMDFN